jgi:hypothetical protein
MWYPQGVNAVLSSARAELPLSAAAPGGLPCPHARALRSRRRARWAALACALACLGVARQASADVTGWVFAGGGATGWKQGDNDYAVNGTLTFDVGAGTAPDRSFIAGGIFRLNPILGEGVDLGLLARVATYGFQGGEIGFALDAGGYVRPWGEGSSGFAGSLNIGGPIGLQLGVNVAVGTNDALAFGATAGIDLLRLTVYRRTLLDWWPNPGAAGKQSARR